MMTVTEALEITINMLNGVNVPVALMDQIGTPIMQAIGNLNECVKALQDDAAKRNAEKKDDIHESGEVLKTIEKA